MAFTNNCDLYAAVHEAGAKSRDSAYHASAPISPPPMSLATWSYGASK